MENVNVVLAANILKYRKKSGFSQDELAQKLGVTFQAVSKWENAKAAPDIAFLPRMADIFGCCIDDLFSREVKRRMDTVSLEQNRDRNRGTRRPSFPRGARCHLRSDCQSQSSLQRD